jgi:AcrR family transcriptional regulator
MVLQDRAKATREAIVAGAAEIFEEYGYGSASLNQVSHAAQVTKGALYFHFQSKDELARAVIEEQHRLVVQDSGRILAEKRPAVESMILMCRAFGLRLVHESVVRAGIRLTLEATAFGHAVQQPYEDWILTMGELATRGQREGKIRASVDPEVLARYIVASFTGVQMVSNVLTDRIDLMQRIEDMWTILLPGIMHNDSREDPGVLARMVSGEVPAAAEAPAIAASA